MKSKYLFAHPESELGRKYFDGNGDQQWALIAVTPIGLYVLRRRTWLERLLRL